MSWYYAEEGKQIGPVEQAEFEMLVGAGRLRPETLVWREGMESWLPYAEVSAALGRAPPAVPGEVDVAVPADAVVCSECGKLYDRAEVIAYGERLVCGGCKPAFVQKLREGAVGPEPLAVAGFWIRFVAWFADFLLLTLANAALGFVLGLGLASGLQSNRPEVSLAVQMGISLVGLLIALTYETVMVGRYGATLGKMACRLKVVTADGGPVSYARALGRYLAKILSTLICYIGFVIAGFDDQRRALHDHLCNTRVVRTD